MQVDEDERWFENENQYDFQERNNEQLMSFRRVCQESDFEEALNMLNGS